MDENDSRLPKSRLPTRTLTQNNPGPYNTWSNFQCPLRKGIIYYRAGAKFFEHDLDSSSKNEPRMITKVTWSGKGIVGGSYGTPDRYLLHLSIHEIHAYRVGPALWTYDDYGYSNIFGLQPMKSTTNTLGITFGVDSRSHMELFDISTDAEKDSYPLVKSGQLNYGRWLDHWPHTAVVLSPDRRILLNPDQNNETIDVFYSGSGDTNNMDFSFVTHVSIPNPKGTNRKWEREIGATSLAFSGDGTKFAAGTFDGVVSVWDVRSKIPLKVFEAGGPKCALRRPILQLQFSSGILGREVLVFMEDDLRTIHLIDATSFETEETLSLPGINIDNEALFFDPRGGGMYTSLRRTLYEWDLRKNPSPDREWWLGDE